VTIEYDDLTEEQKTAIGAFETWHSRGRREGFGKCARFKLEGPAGCGKSEWARFAIEAVGYSLHSSSVAKVAPTGKAAMVMRQKGLDDASTIHSAIYTPQDEVGALIDAAKVKVLELRGQLAGKIGEERAALKEAITIAEVELREVRRRERDEIQWVINPRGMAASAKLIVCDEGSMVSGQLARDLESFDNPVLYLGDSFQLQPIDDMEDSVFFARDGRPLPADFNLTQIHRQAEGSAIIRYTRDIRLDLPGQRFFGKEVGEDGSLVLRLPAQRLSVDHLARAEIVVVGFNETRHRLNEEIRTHLGRTTLYPEPGDSLIMRRNNRDLRLVNGMMATALSGYFDFDPKSQSFAVDVELEDGRVMAGLRMLSCYFQYVGDKDALYEVPAWARARHVHADWAYALSCHSCQGSQWDSGVVLEEGFGRTQIMKRRWKYTAATRFAKNLIVGA
jgi:exodeoxyribonuclease-5